MIYLHTIGDALIKVGEKEIRPTSPLVFAALLNLGTQRGRRVPRAALQELLFPNADERSGAHSLRQLLYKLRQLGTPIHVDSLSVEVSPEDVNERILELEVLGESNGSGTNLREVLPGYEGINSVPFREWLGVTRSAIE